MKDEEDNDVEFFLIKQLAGIKNIVLNLLEANKKLRVENEELKNKLEKK